MRPLHHSFALFLSLIFIPCFSLATDFYWVNGSGNWTDYANHWATTSGGNTFHDSIPGPTDRVFFDSSSFTALSQIVVIDTSYAECLSIDFSGINFSPSFTGTSGDTLNVRDDFVLNNSLNWGFSGVLLFTSGTSTDSTAAVNDTAEIILNGIFLDNDCIFNGQGVWNMYDDFKTSKSILFQQGSLEFNGDTLAALAFLIEDPVDSTLSSGVSFSLERELDFGNATIVVSGAGAAWQVQGSATTIYATQSKLLFSYTGSDSLFFRSDSVNGRLGNVLFPSTTVIVENGADIQGLVLPIGIQLRLETDMETAFNFSSLLGSGNCGNYIEMSSTLPGTQAAIRAKSPGVSMNFVRLQDLSLFGNALTLNNSLNDGNLSGPWIISAPASTHTYYWVNDGGNWTDPTHWATTSGGTGGGCIPGPLDHVIFDSLSFSLTGQVVNLDRNAYCADMTWATIDEAASLNGDAPTLDISGSLALSPLLDFAYPGDVRFIGSGSISTSQKSIPGEIFFLGTAYTLLDSLISARAITQEAGSLTALGRYIAAERFRREVNGGTLTLTNSEILLTGADTVWQTQSTLAGNIDVSGTSIRLTDPSQKGVVFVGDSLTYGDLILENTYTELLGSNSFTLIKMDPGGTLAFENDNIQSLDSLQASGSCDAPVFLQSVSPGTLPATLRKLGNPALSVDNAYITQLKADTTGGVSYTATNSQGFNDTEGWTISGGATGNDFYWIGGQGNWSDPTNWSLSSGGASTTCLPGIGDNVIFDGNSFTSTTDTVFGDITAFFRNMDWTAANLSPTFFQIRDLYPSGNVLLSPNMSWDKLGLSTQMTFRPDSGHATFRTQNLPLNTSIQLLAGGNTDTLELEGDLMLDTLSSIVITRGTFLTAGYDIQAGTFFLATLEPKNISLGSSTIEVFFSWFILDVISGLTFNSGTSEIIVGGFRSNTFFYGNGENYHNVTFLPTEGGNMQVFANNNFNNLTLAPGVELVLPQAGTQVVNGNLSAVGTCQDSISIVSFIPSISSVIDLALTSQVSGECLNVNGISLNLAGTTGNYPVYFSTDQGQNQGFNFSSQPATTASFLPLSSICVEDSASFGSTSTAFSGNTNDLSYVWDFGDGDSAFVANPKHRYSSGGDYPVILQSTYTNGCSDSFEDTLQVREPSIGLSTTEPDFSLCQGDEVTLRVPDTTLTDYTFFVGSNSFGPGTSNEISTSQLQNGDQVYATAIVSGCLASSDTSTYYVAPSPDIQLTYLGTGNTICEGDTVQVLASGVDLYEWYIDTTSQNFPSSDSTFLTTNLQPGQVIKVEGRELSSGCTAFSSDSIALNILPLPTLGLSSSDADRIICEGEPVQFTASGASTYEFFLNGISQGAASTSSTFATAAIQNGGVVSVTGSLQGCSDQFSFLPFSVNPTPTTLLSSNDPDTSICQGTQVSFSATGASAYQFLLNGQALGSISGSNTYVSDTLKDGDRIQAIGFLGDCADTSATLEFEVRNLPLVNLSTPAPDSICAGEVVDFIASGANQYQFFLNGNALGPFSSTNVLSLSTLQSGDLVAVSGNTNGCTSPAPQQYSFTVKPRPVVSLFKITTGNTFCEGETVNFAGVGASQYEFFVNGISQGAPSATSQVGFVLPPGNPIITLKGYTNGCEATSADSIQVQVNPLPTISLTSNQTGQALCQGDTVVVYATGGSSYQFLLDGISQGPPAARDSIVLPNLQSGQVIQAVGSLSACSDTSSNSLSFAIDPLPVLGLTVSDPDLNICEGEGITFSASGANLYEFFLDGLSIGPPSSSSTYFTDSLQNQQVVRVLGFLGNCQAEAPNAISLSVNPAPLVGLNSSDPDTSICEGTSVILSGTGAATYEFFLDGQSQGGPSINNTFQTNALLDGQSVYLVGYSTQNCPDTSETLTFTVLPSPTVALVSDDPNDRLCEGERVTFTASGASAYEFFVDGISVQGPGPLATFSTDSLLGNQVVSVVGALGVCTSNGDTAFSYVVDARPNPALSLLDDAEICVGDSLKVLASGAPQFQFFIDGMAQGGLTSNTTFVFPNLTNGQVVSMQGINNDCRVDADTAFQVTVNDYPAQVSLQSSDPDLSVCYQDSITISAGGAAIYEFFLDGNSISGPDSASSIKVSELENGAVIRVRGAFGECITPSNVSLNFQVTKLDLELTSNPGNLLCEGEPLILNASGADRYEFLLDGQSQGPAGASSSLSLNNAGDGSVAGFIGTDQSSGCVQRADEEIYFRVIPAADITPQGPIAICEGEQLYLETQAEGQVQWYLDGVKLGGERQDSILATSSGIYTIARVQGGEDEAWTVGKNARGQLGDSTTLDRAFLNPAIGDEIVVDVDGGRAFNLAKTLDGRVFAWGDNSFGQLGDGSFVNRTKPQEVPSISSAREVSAGALHSLVRTQTGRVLAFGDNRAGQLGLGNNSVSSFPFEITALTNVQLIEAGANHSLAMNAAGELYAWGENLEGQLGDGTNVNKNSPQLIANLPPLSDLAAGQNHSLVLTENGEVYAWGSNARGQLGLDTLAFSRLPVKLHLPEPIVDVATGAVHSLFLGESGRLYVTGGNEQGQLGLGNLQDVFVPVEIEDLPKGVRVFANDYQSFIQLKDNSIFGWGRNVSGSLGNTDTLRTETPIYLPLLTGAAEISGGLDHLLVRMAYGVACESAGVEVDVKEAPAVSIVENQQELAASPAGTSYQWFVNGNLLVNDTSQTLQPSIGGDYQVEVTFANGCSRLSESYNFIPVAIESISKGDISIYPNPAEDQLWIEASEGSQGMEEIVLYNAVGAEIFRSTWTLAQEKVILNVEKWPRGMYNIRIQMKDGGLYWKKILLTR